MKNKKYIIMILIAIVILLCILIGLIFYKNSYMDKNNFSSDLAIFIGDSSGNYTESDSFPIGNYTLNQSKSVCENGSILSDYIYDSTTGTFNLDFSKTDSCILYFDVIKNLTDQYGNLTTLIFNKNDVLNYTYQGDIKNITLPKGTYKLETWGAAGGIAYGSSSVSETGGNGGYSVGTYTITTNTTIYLVVGGTSNRTNTTAEVIDGGYNGGGKSGYKYSGGGGGATHIATATGLLSALSSNKDAILIVAGGGGGASGYTNASYCYKGGNGGGETGQDAQESNTSYNAKGGTQTDGGEAGLGYLSRSVGGPGTAGSFGTGGDANAVGTAGYGFGGGGGAGYYGGGGGGTNGSRGTASASYYNRSSGGGGGSGYISAILTNASTLQETTSTNPVSGGNGYIRITVLKS